MARVAWGPATPLDVDVDGILCDDCSLRFLLARSNSHDNGDEQVITDGGTGESFCAVKTYSFFCSSTSLSTS
jgi:hypothetical protein